jgi:hypothetical protein
MSQNIKRIAALIFLVSAFTTTQVVPVRAECAIWDMWDYSGCQCQQITATLAYCGCYNSIQCDEIDWCENEAEGCWLDECTNETSMFGGPSFHLHCDPP